MINKTLMIHHLTMIEIFKTNIENETQAEDIRNGLLISYPLHRINFDLDDRDKILRIAGDAFQPATIVEYLLARGFDCQILD